MTDAMINFELVSPEEKLVSEPVKMAVIPGSEGEMGVGAGHSAFVVSLRPGVVKLYREENGEAEKIFIAGGFADITGEACVVLAEEAVNVNDMDAKAIEQSVKDLTEDLGRAEDAVEKARVKKRLVIARARLAAVGG